MPKGLLWVFLGRFVPTLELNPEFEGPIAGDHEGWLVYTGPFQRIGESWNGRLADTDNTDVFRFNKGDPRYFTGISTEHSREKGGG